MVTNNVKFKIQFPLYLIFCLCSFFSAYSQIDYSKFEGVKSTIKLVKEYPFANVYDYGTGRNKNDSLITESLTLSTAEALISKKYDEDFLKNTKDSTVFYIELQSRLLVDLNNQKHYIITYNTSENSTRIVEDYIQNGTGYEENKLTTKEVKLLKSILKNSNAFILFQFYNKRDNPKYPEINSLKSKAKNEQGVLDIVQLAKVLEDNKEKLSKYFN